MPLYDAFGFFFWHSSIQKSLFDGRFHQVEWNSCHVVQSCWLFSKIKSMRQIKTHPLNFRLSYPGPKGSQEKNRTVSFRA